MSETEALPFSRLTKPEMHKAANAFYQSVRTRRTVRDFSDQPIPAEVIETCLLAAGTAPNGANLQPWHFVVVQDPEIKRQIREAAEAEEREFYNGRAPEEWLDALSHLGTDANKPFLETAPALIAIFQQSKTTNHHGEPSKTYYPKESTGIATGILITALHQAGLATLTHTPSPMNFLNEILGRPNTDKPFLLLVCGYPTENCQVPIIDKKPLREIASFL
ncbi:nitroreductase family protein [Verrucomicrobiaceae bacterium N1E253]|uniref:Nitroreductase family protein n=1 Tax=Oceaniferula marina TaxID=2748318 RepID=A0A851GE17_9BACT|nr:nitroreductase family protein [Oceaniferula marina]NWK55399.1 nitroreductase family protein [Oceaniferula marina]